MSHRTLKYTRPRSISTGAKLGSYRPEALSSMQPVREAIECMRSRCRVVGTMVRNQPEAGSRVATYTYRPMSPRMVRSLRMVAMAVSTTELL